MFNKTIQMFIFEGNPNGRIMCELSNWNGRVYKIARSELGLFSSRSDANNTGIYFLFGKDETNKDTVYIGEAEKVSDRLKQHLNDTNYWNDCIAVISKDDLLNKAHVKFLENKFYNLALNSGRFVIINSTIPTLSSVSEYDEAMLEEFIDNAKLLVNTLGYKAFEPISQPSNNANHDIELFYIKAARGADAIGYIVSDGFVVKKDSVIAASTTPSMSESLKRLRTNLLSDGTIDSTNTFTKDFIFTSPSLAAAVVMGRNANGRIEWKTSEGTTIKQIEESQSE
ncbi:GIY-YIG nuclease family protein [uncultured Ruminococcus sp.]|uniref:GIY-YIG nuclease family protein n=1 Tax=uncultured Ruminococcus sp. TaxID=165186 RepID=UPI0025CBF518|nr:GIY-YIG nuclease family protein [uncultured Ruminococcus sp.]